MPRTLPLSSTAPLAWMTPSVGQAFKTEIAPDVAADTALVLMGTARITSQTPRTPLWTMYSRTGDGQRIRYREVTDLDTVMAHVQAAAIPKVILQPSWWWRWPCQQRHGWR